MPNMQHRSIIIALLIVLAIVALYWAYDKCKLDKYYPSAHCKKGKFVGAMGEHAWLVPCAFPTSPSWDMNRCNYA